MNIKTGPFMRTVFKVFVLFLLPLAKSICVCMCPLVSANHHLNNCMVCVQKFLNFDTVETDVFCLE